MSRMICIKKPFSAVMIAILLLIGVYTVTPAFVFAATTGTVNVSALNVRSGASTQTSIIGVLYKNASVEVEESQDGWYKVTAMINSAEIHGYVCSDYITMGEAQEETTELSGRGVVNVAALNVRQGASTASKRLGTIGQGTQVNIKGASGEWYQVEVSLDGTPVTAYVYKSYITLLSEYDSNPGESTGESGIVNTVFGLNLRTAPSTSAGILCCLGKDTEVKITDQAGDWYKIDVMFGNMNLDGYVSAAYITVKTSSSDSSAEPEVKDEEVVVDTSVTFKGKVNSVTGLNLRTDPTTSCSVVAVLGYNTYITIQGETDGWYQVTTTANGKEVSGYVSAEYVTKVDDEAGNQDSISVSDDEAYLLACIVYCEAGNQSYEGQLAVANVVMNRVNSPSFPNTIRDVVYQRNQFSPASNGILAKAMANGVPDSCKEAANDAIAGKNIVPGYYFFNGYVDVSKVTGYTVIDAHTFYYY